MGNPYTYVGNNPWSYSDPLGLQGHGGVYYPPTSPYWSYDFQKAAHETDLQQGKIAAIVGIGLIPVVGTSADVISAGKNVLAGNWTGAALDLLGIIPFWDIIKARRAARVAETCTDDLLSSGIYVGVDDAPTVRAKPNGSPGAHPSVPSDLLEKAADAIYNKLDEIGIDGDVYIQGSVASGTAHSGSDVDILVIVDDSVFEDYLRNKSWFSTPPSPGSAKERSMLYSLENGVIKAGEAKLGTFRNSLQELLGVEVDLTIGVKGCKFDNGPMVQMVRGSSR